MSTHDEWFRGESTSDLARRFCERPEPELLVELVRRLVAEQAEPEYITVSEACERFAISRSTFDREKADRESGLAVLLVRMRGRWLVPVADFHSWLRRRGGPGEVA